MSIELHKYHIFKNTEGLKVINSATMLLMKGALEKSGFKLIYVIDALNKEDALTIFERETNFVGIELIQPMGI